MKTLTKAALMKRGWTQTLISRFAHEPFLLEEIESVEASAEFQEVFKVIESRREASRVRNKLQQLAAIKSRITDWLPVELELNLFCSEVVTRSFVSDLVSVSEYEQHGSRLVVQRVLKEFAKHVYIKPELRSDAEYWLKERLVYYCIWLRQQVLRRKSAQPPQENQ